MQIAMPNMPESLTYSVATAIVLTVLAALVVLGGSGASSRPCWCWRSPAAFIG
jgi:hypothetical protein